VRIARDGQSPSRVVTDRALFAYLADIFVVPEFRGRGISKALMRAILGHPDLAGVTMMLLRTRDAHGLHQQFGFAAMPNPEEMWCVDQSIDDW
jgi:GNAT superfamily N-acetyltransferase